MQPEGYAGDHACIRGILREGKPAGTTSRNTRENLNHVTGGEWEEHATDAKRGKTTRNSSGFLRVIGQEDNYLLMIGHDNFS